jgi:hypothetical protein
MSFLLQLIFCSEIIYFSFNTIKKGAKMNYKTILSISFLVCVVHQLHAMDEKQKQVNFDLQPTVFWSDAESGIAVSFTPSVLEDSDSTFSLAELQDIESIPVAQGAPIDIKTLFPITQKGQPVDVEVLLNQLKEKNPAHHEQIITLLAKPQRIAVRGKAVDEDDYKKVILALTQVIVDTMAEKYDQEQDQAQKNLLEAEQKTQSIAQRGKIQAGVVGLIGTILTVVGPIVTHYLSLQHECAGGVSNSTRG